MTKTVMKHDLDKISEIANIFNIVEIIGGGAFGTVYRAVHCRTDETKALKIGAKYDSPNNTKLHQEIKILSSISHPNIINLEAVYESKKKICLVLEYCPRELSKIVREGNLFNETSVQRIMNYLTGAISYLHRNHIVHRDLKLENILFGDNPDNPKDAWFVKLCDFSVSACKEGKGYDVMLNEICGTPMYMAPEMGTKSYSEQCDVWAMGVIMYLLFQGCFPYPITDPRTIINTVNNTKLDFDTLKCSKAAAQLIRECLQINPALRITAQEMTHSAWIQGKHVQDDNFSQNILILMDEYNHRTNKSKDIIKSPKSYLLTTGCSVLRGLPENTIKSNNVKEVDDDYPKVTVSAVTKVCWDSCKLITHTRQECKGPDRSMNCWMCGKAGHQAQACTAEPVCMVCSDKNKNGKVNHVMGSSACRVFKKSLAAKKKKKLHS